MSEVLPLVFFIDCLLSQILKLGRFIYYIVKAADELGAVVTADPEINMTRSAGMHL